MVDSVELNTSLTGAGANSALTQGSSLFQASLDKAAEQKTPTTDTATASTQALPANYAMKPAGSRWT